ncbi:MAG TPA: glycosyltransferase family 87 protein [Gemmataceae bacterium]|nr:glycosyltransferase family 87 protein [Gemmataceae bacterium]
MPTAPAGRPLSHRLFVLALLLLFVGVSVQYSVKVLTPSKDGLTRSAILRWVKQIQALEDGENIYATSNYPNPPVMPMLLWPLSELAGVSPLAAALTWFYLKVGMTLVCFVWAFRLVESADRSFPAWAKALAVILSIRPIIGDLMHGNINLFILFLVMASLYAFSRGRDFVSGLLLALAITCKVTPALFVVYFVYKRAWGVLLGCAVGLGLYFFVLPSLVFAAQDGSMTSGFQRNWDALTAWYQGMIAPYLVHGIVTPEKENQSLPGVLTRILTHSPSFSASVDGIYTPLAYHNVADLGQDTVKRIVQVCQVLFLVLMVALCRAPTRTPDTRHGWRLAAEYSLILVAMLLFSERTWKHHCVTLMLPFAVLCYGLGALKVRTAGVTAVAAGLFMMTTVSGWLGDEVPKVSRDFEGITVATGPTAYVGAIESGMMARLDLVPDSPGKYAQVYGAYVWAFLALLIGLSMQLRLPRDEPARRP